ncbi:hypothetical protein HYH03_006161 [Edaphochlamys debaryana]|uniref:Uncharacterized protein n=1 Tax=Edaphochlamys debaryana TaxID=47281 RepID=A0A835Y7F1_9CHLO|nr:hypothetical protein HYH03_006161 [Edaphochlamys debaryana]|eukprot:KAG2495561.1 hypothetical protein HYH03_006161 [Edaphochlamys debaryana]
MHLRPGPSDQRASRLLAALLLRAGAAAAAAGGGWGWGMHEPSATSLYTGDSGAGEEVEAGEVQQGATPCRGGERCCSRPLSPSRPPKDSPRQHERPGLGLGEQDLGLLTSAPRARSCSCSSGGGCDGPAATTAPSDTWAGRALGSRPTANPSRAQSITDSASHVSGRALAAAACDTALDLCSGSAASAAAGAAPLPPDWDTEWQADLDAAAAGGLE